MKLIIAVSIMLVSSSLTFSQYEDTGKRGVYFPKKEYSGVNIPSFKENRDMLPSPILENNPEYIELYWKAWELAFNHFKKPPQGSPFVSDFIDEAFAPNVFQWDTFFMIMFARYAHFIFPSIQSLDNFYCRQYENGYICREIVEATGEDFVFVGREHTVNPPLFSWAEVESFKVTGDKSRFEAVLPVLEKYTEWLEKYRKKENTKHGLYWQTGLGSGMDNTPRNGSGWVDISSQMVMCYNDMRKMSVTLGLNDKAEKFRQRAKEISDKINSLMWNEEDGLYYDLDDDGNQVKWKTAACFWPMLAEISTPQQVEKMIMNLRDPKSFWRHVPFPSLAADQEGYQADGKYWLGGVWAPTNVMIIKGIDKYPEVIAYNEFVVEAVQKYLDAIYQVYKKTGTIWENYSPESDMRGNPSQPDFVGWTGCGPIELLIEDILGFRPDGENNRLIWNLNRIDKHGIENLKFGNVTASLVCEKRNDVKSRCKITVKSDNAFELTVNAWKERTETFKIIPGNNILELK